MRKYWKKLILFALMLVTAVVVGKGNVKAATIIESGNCGDNATYILDSDGVLTISGSGEIKEMAFADYSDEPDDADSSYVYADEIKEVVIREGITAIGVQTFYNCRNLKSITMPEGVTKIGVQAFDNCGSVTSITIPESVTWIGDGAFGRYAQLESIYIPKNVAHIGSGAFPNIKTTITVADENAYYNSKDNCNAIIETTTNTLIKGCETTVIPDGVTQIGEYAFENCSGLTNITIPEGVTKIGSLAFYDCSSLTSITLPESVTWIGGSAFNGCGQMESIHIPKNVEHIGTCAFSDIRTTITVANENVHYDSRNNCNAIIETATNTLIIGCGETVIPSDVVLIAVDAFYNCSSLKSITIPESVTEIGAYAFNYCRNLTSVTIPKSVMIIWNGAFDSCDSLTSIAIPEGVTEIEDFAFGNCSLTSIIIPKSVTDIGYYAFGGNELDRITILNNDVVIAGRAFGNVDKNCTIYGYAGSTAEEYALENNITFKVIGSSDDSNNDGNDSGNSDNSNTGTDNSGTNGGTTGGTGSDAGNSGTGGSGSGAAGGGAAQPSGSGSTGATSNAESSSTTETASAGTTTTKTKLTTKNTTIKLSKTSYTYDGKAKKPTVKVLNSKGKVLKSSNYTVKYSNNVKAGKATVTIKFKGKYTGTIKATYTIKPKTTAITGVTRNGSKVALIWKKQATQTSGYQIQYATDKKFTKDKQLVTVSGAKKTSKTIKNLSENKNYYFRIRTYKTVNGKKVYSVWSKSKIVKTEK